MSRWIRFFMLALALSLVFAEDESDEEKDEETTPAEGENKKPTDGMTDKEREAMMERMQNIHLYHDAFLGDYVIGFRELNKADRESKLQELINNKIDTDKDGFISVEELREHFRRVSLMYRKREIEETLKDQDEDKDGKISWDEFAKHNYGGDEGEDQKEMMAQDNKKFFFADMNGDKLLNLEEYHGFNHPVDDERMTNFSIDEHLQKHDTDRDGYITYEEFLSSFTDIDDDSIKEELKKDFDENYDKDHNGKLDREEIKSWAIPEDIFINEEPPKLVTEADDDKDGKLSPAEMSKHINLFMDKPVDEEQAEEGPGGDTTDDAQSAKGGKHDEL